MVIKLTVNCPSCGRHLYNEINDIAIHKNLTVHVMYFEQTSWDCEDCEKNFTIGDINLVDTDRILFKES